MSARQKRTYHVTCINKPDVFEVAKFFEGYEGNDLWVLSIEMQMNRCTSTDRPILEHLFGGFKVQLPNPNTPYISCTTMTFETPITRGFPNKFHKFIGQLNLLGQHLANYQPINPFYINRMQLLQLVGAPPATSSSAFNIATLQKEQKVLNPAIRTALNDALIGKCLMPVDLVQINDNVKTKIRGRGKRKPYTNGTKIGKNALYGSKEEPKRYFPSLVKEGLLMIHTCIGSPKAFSRFSAEVCSIELF